MQRIEVGYVDVRNPFYPQQVSRILLDQEHIDAFVFCTKNPLPALPYLDALDAYKIMFHVTLTPYRKDIEPYVPDKREVLKAIQILSKRFGPDFVFVRYDPIFINDTYTLEYHAFMFERLCKSLQGFIHTVIISFLDMKKNTKKHQDACALQEPTLQEVHAIASRLASIAQRYEIKIQTCAEPYDLSAYGVRQGSCINALSMYNLTEKNKRYPKNKNREYCHCLESVDIGAYNCCPHFCRYCYANYDEKQVGANQKKHKRSSSLLIGELDANDTITIRKK